MLLRSAVSSIISETFLLWGRNELELRLILCWLVLIQSVTPKVEFLLFSCACTGVSHLLTEDKLAITSRILLSCFLSLSRPRLILRRTRKLKINWFTLSDVAILMRLTQLLVAHQEKLVEQQVGEKLHPQHVC